MIGLLSGRAAEIVLLGSPLAGAGGSERSDLALATRMLAAKELSYGLADERLTYVVRAENAHAELRSDPSARKRIDGIRPAAATTDQEDLRFCA